MRGIGINAHMGRRLDAIPQTAMSTPHNKGESR